MKTQKICSINIENSNSWKNKIFLTFDIDWASDDVFYYTLDLLNNYNVSATFFCTHDTKILDELKKNKKYELGIHPNFNYLLNGNFRYGKDYIEVLKYYKDIVPESISVRSHSLTQQSNLLTEFSNHGLKFELNLLIPEYAGYLQPFKYGDLMRVPYIWEDDVHCMFEWKYDVTKFLSYQGVRVFNFHPIHIFLNTEKLDRYTTAKPHLQNYNELQKHINNETYGTKDFLISILEQIK